MSPAFRAAARRVVSLPQRNAGADDAAAAAAEKAGVAVSAAQLIALRHDARGIVLSALRVRATQSGLSRSPFRGRGMEFEESRRYDAGDDIRNLDWRVTARTGELHTKLYREERERPVVIWTDFRAPMFFATQGVFKAVQAARLAALLAWSAVANGDRVGGIVFSAEVHREVRPRGGRTAALRVIHELASHPAWRTGPVQPPDGAGEAALFRLRRLVRPGSLLFLLSDFRDLGDSADTSLAALGAHNDVVAIDIGDRMERSLPPAGQYRLDDGHDALSIDTSDRALRLAHRESFEMRHQALASVCRRHGIFLLDCSTADDATTLLRERMAGRPGSRRATKR